MKTRAEAVAFIARQFTGSESWETITGRPKYAHHYGRQELRELMDFIYEGEPQSDDERIGKG